MKMIISSSNNEVRPFFIQEILNCLCYFAPLSFIAIYLYDNKHFDKVEVGLAMLLGIWASRCSRILLAPFIDKIKVNFLIPGLQLLGAVGYLLLTTNTPPVFISIFMISICYGNNSMLIRVLINQIDNPTTLNKRFAVLHVATNIAAMFGPVIFNIIALYYNMTLALNITALTLVFSAVYSYLSLTNSVIPKQQSYFKNIKLLFTHTELLKVYVLIIIAYFFYAQIFSLAPILLANTYHLKSYIWVVGFSNSLVAVLFSVKINDFFHKTMSVYMQITCGFILAILGFSLLLCLKNPLGVIGGVILISLAEIAFIPGFQVMLSQKTIHNQKVAIFAINALCMGVGEGFGQYYGVLTGLGDINFYNIAIIYSILTLGIFLSLTFKQSKAFDL